MLGPRREGRQRLGLLPGLGGAVLLGQPHAVLGPGPCLEGGVRLVEAEGAGRGSESCLPISPDVAVERGLPAALPGIPLGPLAPSPHLHTQETTGETYHSLQNMY